MVAHDLELKRCMSILHQQNYCHANDFLLHNILYMHVNIKIKLLSPQARFVIKLVGDSTIMFKGNALV